MSAATSTPYQPRHVLVTGVGGFIGSHVAEALVRSGLRVRGVDAFVDSYERRWKEANLAWLRSQERFSFLEADLRTSNLDLLVDGVDTVVHEAAFAGLARSWVDVQTYFDCNVLAVSRLVDACRRHDVSRFVHASTSSVYGRHAVGDETMPVDPVSPYGISKLAGEQLLRAHVHEHGFPAVILRYFSIYGPRQRPDMAYRIFTQRLLRGEPLIVYGDGRQSRSNTFVSDCVGATLAAIHRGRIGEAYNIGGGEEVALGDVIAHLGDLLQVAPRIVRRPERAGDQRRTAADVSKAADELGYRPETSVVEGLRAQVSWHLEAAVTAPSGHPYRSARTRPVLAAQSSDVPAAAGAIS